MIARGWGRIVHIATGAAKYPHVLRLLSGAPRAALVNYAVAMAKVLAPHGVTINTMLPVMHHTPGIRAIYEAQAQARGTSYDIEVARMVKEAPIPAGRSEEHTSELQSLMRISYAVFCLNKKTK